LQQCRENLHVNGPKASHPCRVRKGSRAVRFWTESADTA
jgi:hypothetical protein